MSSIVAQGMESKRVLLMGNEAIARGALEAGMELMAAYPGTPSSEIGETLAACAEEFDYYIEWSTNEKVAFEVAAGASLVGARSLVAMKNAGLNVAMDTFMTLPYTGVKGGMVIVVADDPDAHYSSTEQDTRTAAAYAEIPCLEPADQQEAKDMTREAFALSERLSLPVFVRSVTRISHASGDVRLNALQVPRHSRGFNKHWQIPYRWDVYGPPGSAACRHKWLHGQLPKAAAESAHSPFNQLLVVNGAEAVPVPKPVPGQSYSLGVIASGLGSCYAREALARLGRRNVLYLKIGVPFPLPRNRVEQVLTSVEKLLLIEEGDPVVENQVKAIACDLRLKLPIYGKASSPVLPPYGEINTDLVAAAFGRAIGGDPPRTVRGEIKARERMKAIVAPRSSTLCAGCPHLGSYWGLREILHTAPGVHIVNGDIGCYEQGGYGIFSRSLTGDDSDAKRYRVTSPYEILDTIYVMGSGIGMALGQAQAGYTDGKIVAVCGDSTYYHATLPALVDAVYTGADLTFLVFDNSWTCMTGHQPSLTTGLGATGRKAPTVSIEEVAKSIGLTSVAVADAYDLAVVKSALKAAFAFKGPSIVVLRRECALQVQRREKRQGTAKTYVEREACTGCRICVELGCPAIVYDGTAKKAGVDEILCVDCGLCAQVCARQAIRVKSE